LISGFIPLLSDIIQEVISFFLFVKTYVLKYGLFYKNEKQRIKYGLLGESSMGC
jgi:hypothetical protein